MWQGCTCWNFRIIAKHQLCIWKFGRRLTDSWCWDKNERSQPAFEGFYNTITHEKCKTFTSRKGKIWTYCADCYLHTAIINQLGCLNFQRGFLCKPWNPPPPKKKNPLLDIITWLNNIVSFKYSITREHTHHKNSSSY